MRAPFYAYLAAGSCLLLVACTNPLKGLLITKGQKEKEVAALKTEYEAKVVSAQTSVSAAKDAVIAAKDSQMQGAAGAFYGQSVVFGSLITPTRTDLIQHNLSIEGWSALGNIVPTAEAMKAMNERLSKELDSTKTALSDLQADHVKALAENSALAAETQKHEKELKGLQDTLTKTQLEGAAKLAAKTSELVETQDKLIAAEKARADDRVALQALKTKMSIVLGILALAGLAGAIYSPVLKQQCALFGAACGAASIGLWFVQPWMVAVGAGVTILAAIGWILVKHRKEEKVSDALVLAAEDIKDKSTELWSQVGPIIEERLKQYVTKGGKLVAETDHKIAAYIDKKKADWDRL